MKKAYGDSFWENQLMIFGLKAENSDLTTTRPKVRDLNFKFLDKVLLRSIGVRKYNYRYRILSRFRRLDDLWNNDLHVDPWENFLYVKIKKNPSSFLQCCGSVMLNRIPDPKFSIPGPGFRVKRSRFSDPDPVNPGSRFFPHHAWIQGSKKHRIPEFPAFHTCRLRVTASKINISALRELMSLSQSDFLHNSLSNLFIYIVFLPLAWRRDSFQIFQGFEARRGCNARYWARNLVQLK